MKYECTTAEPECINIRRSARQHVLISDNIRRSARQHVLISDNSPECINIRRSARQHVLISNNSPVRKNYFDSNII